jgi:hypothetical protein
MRLSGAILFRHWQNPMPGLVPRYIPRRNSRQPLELVFYCVTRRTTTMVGWVRQPSGWPLLGAVVLTLLSSSPND